MVAKRGGPWPPPSGRPLRAVSGRVCALRRRVCGASIETRLKGLGVGLERCHKGLYAIEADGVLAARPPPRENLAFGGAYAVVRRWSEAVVRALTVGAALEDGLSIGRERPRVLSGSPLFRYFATYINLIRSLIMHWHMYILCAVHS